MKRERLLELLWQINDGLDNENLRRLPVALRAIQALKDECVCVCDEDLPSMVPGRGAGSVQAEDGGDTESTSSLVSDEAGGRSQGAGSAAARPRRTS